jgi:hypothetical protein
MPTLPARQEASNAIPSSGGPRTGRTIAGNGRLPKAARGWQDSAWEVRRALRGKLAVQRWIEAWTALDSLACSGGQRPHAANPS